MFHTIERLLGAEPNKIEIIDLNILKQFFDYLEKTPISGADHKGGTL